VYGVEELQIVPVSDAQTASIEARGDPGAAIRGPLVGEEAHGLVTGFRALQSPQEGADPGVPHAQESTDPSKTDQAGRAPIGRGVRPDQAQLSSPAARPCEDKSGVALRRPHLRSHSPQVRHLMGW
jgi:hypothetical protein